MAIVRRTKLRAQKVTSEELAEAMALEKPTRAQKRAHRQLTNRVVDQLIEQYAPPSGTELTGKYRVWGKHADVIRINDRINDRMLGSHALRGWRAKFAERREFLRSLEQVTAKLKELPSTEQREQQRRQQHEEQQSAYLNAAKSVTSAMYGGGQVQ